MALLVRRTSRAILERPSVRSLAALLTQPCTASPAQGPAPHSLCPPSSEAPLKGKETAAPGSRLDWGRCSWGSLGHPATLPFSSISSSSSLCCAREQQGAGTSSGQRALAHASAATVPQNDMFCFQCEQTKDGKGCTTWGVCGKDPFTAALQDLLIHSLKGLSQYAVRAQEKGISDPNMDFFVQEAIFSTLTNVNFDAKAIQGFIEEVAQYKHILKAKYEEAGGTEVLDNSAATFSPPASLEDLVQEGRKVGVEVRRAGMDEDMFSLQELVTYGIKGTAAYAAHAHAVGKADPAVSHYFYEALDYLSRPASEQSVDGLLGMALKCGATNYRAMEILNQGHIASFGTPEPTQVRTSHVQGKCIAVSGHDIKDLYELLKATEGTGVNVYTHGELLPAHGYPELKKFPHLVGNYGGPWQWQKMDFALFPGPILVTTNCITEPKESYQDRVYTCNAVGHTKAKGGHIRERDFTSLIDQALAMPGFPSDAERETHTMTGFGHDAVLSMEDKLVELVKEGKIRRFFLIGGCDGFEGERSYYRNLALALPKDTVILTLACGKYRFNKMMEQLGTVEGTALPRMLDVGQCNDAYSAIRIASALADAFKTDVNSLPLSMVLSWFEQKAVAVLLTLLHLNIQNIRIGPKLPAFMTPNVLNILAEKYKLTPIGEVEEDMNKMLA